MLQSMIQQTIWFPGIVAICLFGLLGRIITDISNRRLRRATANMSKTRHRFVTEVKKKYENYEKFGKMRNIEVFVDKLISRRTIFLLPARIWDNLSMQCSVLAMIVGVSAAYRGYCTGQPTINLITTLFSAFFGASILLFLQMSANRRRMRDSIEAGLKDYLENVMSNKMGANFERKLENAGKESSRLPSRKEIDRMNAEIAVTDAERRVLKEVLEEYFW